MLVTINEIACLYIVIRFLPSRIVQVLGTRTRLFVFTGGANIMIYISRSGKDDLILQGRKRSIALGRMICYGGIAHPADRLNPSLICL